MTDITAALEAARELVRIDEAGLAYVLPGSLQLARTLLALAAEREAMAAVVAGAQESYAELGALDLRVGEIIDEDDVRCWQAHERAIGEPLRQYRAALDGHGGAK